MATVDTPTDTPRLEAAIAHIFADYVRRFRDLAEQWKRETTFLSALDDKYSHPSYRAIIELGLPVVPLLLSELLREPDWWFGALREITGENPARPEHAGKLQALAEDWLRWGREHGYA